MSKWDVDRSDVMSSEQRKDPRRAKRLKEREAKWNASRVGRKTELARHEIDDDAPKKRYLRISLKQLKSTLQPDGYVAALRACAVVETEHFVTVDVNSPGYREVVRRFHQARRQMLTGEDPQVERKLPATAGLRSEEDASS